MKAYNKEQSNESALRITKQELINFGINEKDIKEGQAKGDLKTFGPWQIPISYKALAIETNYTPKEQQRFSAQCEDKTIHGLRAMGDCRQNGHCLMGRVSIKGKKVKGFTDSQLFELENGDLVDVATIEI